MCIFAGVFPARVHHVQLLALPLDPFCLLMPSQLVLGGTVAQNLHLCQYPLSRDFLFVLSITDPMPDNDPAVLGPQTKAPVSFIFSSNPT